MPLHRRSGDSLHPTRSGVRRVFVLGGDRDGGEDEPVSRRSADRDGRHVLEEGTGTRFERHVVDHAGATQHVRDRPAVQSDPKETGGLSGELDVRAFETRRTVGAGERSDDRLLDRPVGSLGRVARRLDLNRGRRRFRVPGQADDDRQPASSFPLQHLEIVRNFLVGREDGDGPRGERLAPTGGVHVVDLPLDQIDDDLLSLMAMTPELRTRCRHRLGEAFERQPRSMLPTREQEAGGLVGCVDLPMSDGQAAGFPRARHGSVSPHAGSDAAEYSSWPRGRDRSATCRDYRPVSGDPKPEFDPVGRNSNEFRKSIPRARHSSPTRDTNGTIVSRSPIRRRSSASSDPSRCLAIASGTPHRASSARVNIFFTPALANASAMASGVHPPVGGYAGAKPTNVVRPASARIRRQRSRASIGGAHGSRRARARSSRVGTDMPTSISSNWVNRSRSRVISGARERTDTGHWALSRTSSACRVIRYFPSTNWYGSVAVEIATSPLDRRFNSFARTVAAFRFTTTEAPQVLRSICRIRGT